MTNSLANARGKMVTIKDVAERAGVSNGTVSRFFHEPHRVNSTTREKIQSAINELGYAPNALARNFRLGSTGVIIVLTSGIGDPFYGDIIAGIDRIAKARGYTVRIEERSGEPLSSSELNSLVSSHHADGIVVIGSPAPFAASTHAPTVDRHPHIVVCGEVADPELMHYPRFQINGHVASRELLNYLIGLGHRRIAFMSGSNSTVVLDERERGYREGMQEHGLMIDEDWVTNGQLEIDGARRATQDLLNARIPPTAIICASDEMALGTMAELQAQGYRVPEDISVAGFDDTRYAGISNPPLTTVAQPAKEMGERAMYSLLKALKGDVPPAAVEYLAHQLIIRQSTSPVIDVVRDSRNRKANAAS